MKKMNLLTVLLVITLSVTIIGCESYSVEDNMPGELNAEIQMTDNLEAEKAIINVSNTDLKENQMRELDKDGQFVEIFSDLEAGVWNVELLLKDNETGVNHIVAETKADILSDESTAVKLKVTKDDFEKTINDYKGLENRLPLKSTLENKMSIKSVSNDLYKIISRENGDLIEVSSASTDPGANVIVWEDNGGNNQHWWLDTVGGDYKILNDNSGQALEVAYASTDNEANVVQYPYNDDDLWHQRWEITHVNSGYYSIINIYSGKSLDIYDGNVIQWDYWGGDNQQFAFESMNDDGNGDIVNVIDFGAESYVYSCQAGAFNDAMWHLYSQGGGTVYVPAGNYYFESELRLHEGVNLRGDGMGESTIWGDNANRYLISNPEGWNMNMEVADLTFYNPSRLLLLNGVANMIFSQVEFYNGLVRFEESSDITIDSSRFENADAERGAYSGDVADNMTLTNNTVINPTGGGFNLSRHNNSYVANNTIESDERIYSGYAGIRLPNGANNNTVENNTIIRTGRGIFVLSGSDHNTVRNNQVYDITHQGIFVESPHNIIVDNLIKDIGDESIYVADTTGNWVENNYITDSRYHGGDRYIGLKAFGQENTIINNNVSADYYREFKNISESNTSYGNIYE